MNSKGPSRLLGEGRFLRLIERDGWELVERPGVQAVVAVIAVTPSDELVLVEQYREPVENEVIELPAGLVGDEGLPESIVDAGRRELEEETGYRAETLRLLTMGPPSAGQSSELVSILLARDVRRVGSGGGVGDESIQTHLVPQAAAAGWLEEQATKGRFIDPKVWLALYFLGRD